MLPQGFLLLILSRITRRRDNGSRIMGLVDAVKRSCRDTCAIAKAVAVSQLACEHPEGKGIAGFEKER